MSSKFQASFRQQRIGRLIRRMILACEGIAMAFFKRELGPIERARIRAAQNIQSARIFLKRHN